MVRKAACEALFAGQACLPHHTGCIFRSIGEEFFIYGVSRYPFTLGVQVPLFLVIGVGQASVELFVWYRLSPSNTVAGRGISLSTEETQRLGRVRGESVVEARRTGCRSNPQGKLGGLAA